MLALTSTFYFFNTLKSGGEEKQILCIQHLWGQKGKKFVLKPPESSTTFNIKVLAVSSAKMSKKKEDTRNLWFKDVLFVGCRVCAYYQCRSSIQESRDSLMQGEGVRKWVRDLQHAVMDKVPWQNVCTLKETGRKHFKGLSLNLK